MLIEGPNCLGLVNYIDAIPLTFVVSPIQKLTTPNGIAIVSQSGAMAAALGVSCVAAPSASPSPSPLATRPPQASKTSSPTCSTIPTFASSP